MRGEEICIYSSVNELPEKEIQVQPAKDMYNSAERLQEANDYSS